MKSNAMIAVWMDVPAVHEAEFNDWYENEHLAEVVAIPGILAGRRFFNPSSDLRYLVLYESTDTQVEKGSGFQLMLSHPTAWTLRIRTLCAKPSRRINFELRKDSGPGEDGAFIVAVHHAMPWNVANPGGENAGLPLPGCVRHRVLEDIASPRHMLELFEFATEPHFKHPLFSMFRHDGGAQESDIYRSIGKPLKKQ